MLQGNKRVQEPPIEQDSGTSISALPPHLPLIPRQQQNEPLSTISIFQRGLMMLVVPVVAALSLAVLDETAS